MPSKGQFAGDRAFWISGPLADAGFVFSSMTATEELSTLYHFEVTLLAEKEDVPLADFLGKDLTVSMELANGKERHFHGIVTRFALVGRTIKHAQYRASVRPRLWLLTQKADCRIFQKKSVSAILKSLFDKHEIKSDISLGGQHPDREYCVQYRETDFTFACRLMEQEGIYFYFTHDDGSHTLVLTDELDPGHRIAGYEKVGYLPPTDNLATDEDLIHEWTLTQEVQPGSFTQTDYDFTRPKAGLGTKKASPGPAAAELEVYDYPGDYVESGHGDWYAQCRLEALQAQHERVQGAGNVRGLAPAARFKLEDYPRRDQNREYQVVSVVHELQANEYGSGDQAATYACRFTAMDAKRQFRPACVTPRAYVRGPQTAVVVGPQGEEIYTDKYGRVKVLFHWDRGYSYAQGKYDENTSCWVRVAQVWSGKGWGGIQIPRIGHEVVVEFLEGDPDRPLITGSVYNADTMPPYELPANMTQSGIRSRSTKGAGPANYNEVRFEDKKGEEQLLIHAEKNKDVEVENDETHWVGNDRAKTIDRDEKTEVKRNRTERVGENEDISIGKDRSEAVKGNESIVVEGNRSKSVGKNEDISIGGNRSLDIGKDDTVSVGGSRSESISKNESLTINGKRDVTIGESDTQNISKTFSLVAGDEISLEVGSATLVMKKDGTIQINGKDLTVSGSGKINVKATSNLVLKGSKVEAN